jgi:O-antigen ligase
MMVESACVERSITQARAPWTVYAFLLVIFGLASFDFLMSVHYVERKDQTIEAKLEESVELTEAGNVRRQAALLLLGVAAVASLLRRDRNPIRFKGASAALLLFFVAWAWASILWSYDEALTLRRVVILSILLIAAVAAAERFSFRDIILFAFVSGCATIIVGLAAELALGMFRPWDAEYRFAGVMNPIFQGAHCGMTAVAALALIRQYGKHRKIYLAAAMVAILFMLLTRSRGPVGATMAALVVYGWAVRPAFRKVALLGAAAVIAVLAFPSMRLGFFSKTEDALLFGRTVDSAYEMQGRDALWRECLKFAQRRPILGYGYDGFWTRDFTFAVTDASGFTSQHTHNAFLDLLLGVGLPGALAFLAILALAIKQSAARYRQSRNACHAAATALLILYLIHNMFVSVQLASQLQTFVALAIVMKLAFVPESEAQPEVLDEPANG